MVLRNRATIDRSNGKGTIPMLATTETIAAIDVGTTKVCTIVGRKAGPRGIHILGHSTVPSNGLRKGNVTDVAATEKAVRESIHAAEQSTGHHIQSAFVGVTGAHVGFENRRDRLVSVGQNGVITTDELRRDPEALAHSLSNPGRKLIHAVKMSYSVDGDGSIRNPLGMHSRDVEVETHLVTGGTPFINKLLLAVENTGVTVESLVLEPLASGLAVLTPQEKERGAVLVDIGGGTTDVVAFRQGRIRYTGVIPVGGHQFTNDIATIFNTPYEAAEDVKLKYAHTELPSPGSDHEISLPVIGQGRELRTKRREICQLTRERAQELARLIKLKLDEAEWEDPSALRVVLTGGTSNLPGLVRLMQRTLGIPVRHGVPSARGVIPHELKDPAYATGVGILLWATTEYVPSTNGVETTSNGTVEVGSKGLLSGLLGQLSKLMSLTIFATRKGRI